MLGADGYLCSGNIRPEVANGRVGTDRTAILIAAVTSQADRRASYGSKENATAIRNFLMIQKHAQITWIHPNQANDNSRWLIIHLLCEVLYKWTLIFQTREEWRIVFIVENQYFKTGMSSDIMLTNQFS